MDSDLISLLVFVAISALSALSNWLQKRKQAAEEAELWPPAPVEVPPAPRRAMPNARPGRATTTPVSTPKSAPAPAPPAPPRMSDWEAELRRMLEGMDKPAAPPPVIVVPPAPPPPPPVESAPPAAPARVLGRQATERRPTAIYAEATEEAPEPSRRLAVLHESADAHAKAGRLHEGLAMRMRQFERSTEARAADRLQSAERREEGTTDAVAARHWLADRSGLRQAMIASIVLGPPRSAEL